VKRIPGEIVRAAGILLMTREREPRFLLMRHKQRWDLPKGHNEPDESFLEAALRETEEETGIAAADITIDPGFHFDLVYPVTYKRTGDQVFTKQVRFFLGYIDRPVELRLTEHESARWFSWEPPHRIQAQTIDPLLAAVASHLRTSRRSDTD
jgi:8-oxo-dGTP pyrophosphatase MutT (NUDIX family)